MQTIFSGLVTQGPNAAWSSATKYRSADALARAFSARRRSALASPWPCNSASIVVGAPSRKPLDKLPDTCLELDRPDHADLEAEVAQGGTKLVLDGNGLPLKQLAMGQQHPKLLAA